MIWYKNLYLGTRAFEQQDTLLRSLKHKKWIPGVYVITLPANPSNMLDIYETTQFLQPSMKKMNLKAVGVAIGKEEALSLVETMVDDIYQNTGGFDFEKFLNI